MQHAKPNEGSATASAKPPGESAADASAVNRALQPLSSLDSFPYRNRVKDVMSAPPLVVDGTAAIGDALRMLIEKKTSSVFVRDASGTLGIVTERDVLRAVNARGADALRTPVDAIAVRPLQSVSSEAFVYRAIARMDRLGVRHLAVRDPKGAIVGALTTRNLLRHRAGAALTVGDEIDSAPDAATIAKAKARLPGAAKLLREDGVEPATISAIISSEYCLMTRRAAQLAEQAMAAAGRGTPPVPYCVLILGSAGRGESLLSADQDNAIVFASGAPGGPEDMWFAAMAEHMAQILDDAGIPFCKGGVMAKNAAWRHSVDGWKEVARGWVGRQSKEDLLSVDIFFDALPVHGDARLGEEIWNYAYEVGHAAADFQKLLTENARDRHPPFTVFGGIKTDEEGRVDIKKGGLMPIFGGARVLSIRHDARLRATPDRLRSAAGKGASPEDLERIVEAQRHLLGLMLDQQLADSARGVELSPRIAVDRLGREDKARLKQSLRAVDTMIAVISEGRH